MLPPMSRSWPKNKVFQVGLTGGIGAGKSVAGKFWKLLGIPVFNADDEAKGILATSAKVKSAVIALLGEAAYANGVPDRAFIASAVFGNDALLKALNAIIHPAVGEAYAHWVVRNADAPYVIKEAAILFELGQQEAYDFMVLVTAPEDLRIERVMERNSLEREEVLRRIHAQWPDEKKEKLADAIILNDDEKAIIPQVLHIDTRIKELLKQA